MIRGNEAGVQDELVSRPIKKVNVLQNSISLPSFLSPTHSFLNRDDLDALWKT